MAYISQCIVFIIALFGIVFKSVQTDDKGNVINSKYQLSVLTQLSKYQLPALTRPGKIIVVFLFASFFISLYMTHRGSQEAKEKEDKLAAQLAEVRKQNDILFKGMDALSKDRNLNGIEVSFKPSSEQWSKIAKACDAIPDPNPGFPYKDSTIIAERVGEYWRLDFLEIRQETGTIRPKPNSTNQPGGKPFEEVIQNVLVELLITWRGEVETEVSPRGNYPSLVKVSKDEIAYTFRPPLLSLNLSKLKADPKVAFRGGSEERPSQIRVRSLDDSVTFDQTMNLHWEEKYGDRHVERMMPYAAGPYPLQIKFNNLPSQ
jgi:hypothetical protein